MATKFYYLIISITLFLFSANVLFAQGGWQQVTSPQSGYGLYGIHFKDINTGVCSKFRTTNGGSSWYQPTIMGGGYAMMFPDQNTGYYTGPGIYKTTNLGENWIILTNPVGAYLKAVYFPNVNTGYACGQQGNIIKTSNGGDNWVQLNSPVSSSYLLNGIFFVDPYVGYVVGYESSNISSTILRSTDGGNNWTVQNLPANTGFDDIFFVNSNTGIVVGMKAAKTTDAGTTWISKSIPSGGFFYSLYFSSVNTGFAVGFGGSIIKTTNCGETWFEQTSLINSTLNSVYFINDNTGFACGDDGVVLKTTDGGGPPIGIKPISNEVPKEFSLYQNYPNPFNPLTKIRYQLSSSNDVKIVIYDITGKEIETLLNENQPSGTYEVSWDASNFASGLYFYKIKAGNFVNMKKMVLLK